MVKAFLLLLLGFCLTGCITTQPATPASSGHVEVSAQIKTLMHRMERLVLEREMTDREVETVRIQQAERLRRIADRLVNSTETLVVSGDVEQFRAYAERFRAEAYQAEQRARSGDPARLREAFASVDAACNACHRAFWQEL